MRPTPAPMIAVMDPFGRTFNRLLAVFGLAIVFVGTASIISPRLSAAGPGGGHSLSEGQIIGRLIGPEQEVVIRATRLGPRYWVYDLSGSLVASNLTIEQLGRRYTSLSTLVGEMGQGAVRVGSVDLQRDRSIADER